jgi:hypothetical protein
MKVLKRAMIVFNDGFATMPCAILEISPVGARLRAEAPQLLPDEFDLMMPSQESHHCEVVRRRSLHIAVRFAD